jgi:hypothetical protein
LKVSPKDIKHIKSQIPLIIKLINQEVNDKELNDNDVKIYAFSLWTNWLSRDDYDKLFEVQTDQELVERRNRFNHLFHLINESTEPIFSWNFNKWKNRTIIKGFSNQQKRRLNCAMDDYSGEKDSIIKLILPTYKATIEMGYDWTGQINIIENDKAEELYELINKSGLFYFEY